MKRIMTFLVMMVILSSCDNQSIEFKDTYSVPIKVTEKVSSVITTMNDSITLPDLFIVEQLENYVYIFKVSDNKAIPYNKINIRDNIDIGILVGFLIGLILAGILILISDN